MPPETQTQTNVVPPVQEKPLDGSLHSACSVLVNDPRFGTPHTLTIKEVTATAVTVHKDPPYKGMFALGRQQPDHPSQGYDQASMEAVLRNMRGNGHPALAIFESAYAQMTSQNDKILPTCATGGSTEETKS